MQEINELQIVVTKKTAGILETNLAELENFVNERLQDYTPEKFTGDADSAKKSRAELNSAKKAISAERIRIIKELMKPFEEFETRCKSLEKNIDIASSALDAIVKFKEDAEKAEKKAIIEERWRSKDFTLVPLEKIFDQKWLNKTAKIKDVEKEIDAIIEKIYSDIKTIEAFGVEVETLKPIYLDTLDIGSTITRGNVIKENRERLEKEKAERAEREKIAALQEQQKEIIAEEKKAEQNKEPESLASQALGIKEDNDPVITFNCIFTGKKSELLKMRQYMTDHGITYTKVGE